MEACRHLHHLGVLRSAPSRCQRRCVSAPTTLFWQQRYKNRPPEVPTLACGGRCDQQIVPSDVNTVWASRPLHLKHRHGDLRSGQGGTVTGWSLNLRRQVCSLQPIITLKNSFTLPAPTWHFSYNLIFKKKHQNFCDTTHTSSYKLIPLSDRFFCFCYSLDCSHFHFIHAFVRPVKWLPTWLLPFQRVPTLQARPNPHKYSKCGMRQRSEIKPVIYTPLHIQRVGGSFHSEALIKQDMVFSWTDRQGNASAEELSQRKWRNSTVWRPLQSWSKYSPEALGEERESASLSTASRLNRSLGLRSCTWEMRGIVSGTTCVARRHAWKPDRVSKKSKHLLRRMI